MTKKKSTIACLIAVAMMTTNCEDPPPPMAAQANYTTCEGLRGTCGADDCCSTTTDRSIVTDPSTDDPYVECEVRQGPGDSYVLDFRIAHRGSNGPAIEGVGFEFQSSATQLVPLRTCGSFSILDNGREYSTPVCDQLDVRSDDTGLGGGGCEIRIFINTEDVIEGTFQCKELSLPPNSLYLSTISRGGLGNGGFNIDNCDFRL